MSRIALLALIIVVTLGGSPAVAAEIKLHHLERRSGETNEWWVGTERLRKVPKWDPSRQNPPLELAKALKIAMRWLATRDGATTPGQVDAVMICSLHAESGELRNMFYYRVDVVPREFDQMSCIVLMDGTVVEPKQLSPKHESSEGLGQSDRRKADSN